MFTGIVEELGSVLALEHHEAGARIRIGCSTVLSDAVEGCSIAVNGCCLTALGITLNSFSADLAPETLRLTNLGDLAAGSLVNLERPLLPTSRLSGHIVQGHVDTTGEVVSLAPLGDDNWWLKVRIPAELDRYLVYKGSITIDGMSLTIAGLEGDLLSVTIIPHTYEATNLRLRKAGDRLNLEPDIVAKHVEKLLKR